MSFLSPLFPSSPMPSAAGSFTTGRRVLSALLTGLVASVAFVGTAQAVPVDVFFNGPRPASDPNTAFGISLASAVDARDNFGVPIIDGATLSSITSKLSVIQPPTSSLVITPNPPTAPVNRAISDWQVENVSGATMLGASYVLFTHTDPFTANGSTIDYPDANVGLRIDAAEGWAIVRGSFGGVDYYYPALLLDRQASTPLAGDLSDGERVTASIHYVVNQALIGVRRNGTTTYYLPELQLGFAQVVPEPGTALLLGLGLSALAAGRKRSAAR
jgi:PEP-CTERM motif